jgi:hypothetical protein
LQNYRCPLNRFFKKSFKYPFTTNDLENSLIKLHLPKIRKVEAFKN